MADAFDEMVLAIDVRYFASTVLLEDYKKIAALIYPKPRYREFNIPKKSGGKRAIAAPRKKLKILQQRLLSYLVAKIDPPKACVHGFVPGRNVVTNASKHSERNPRFILNVDLENFFPTITFYRVRGVFLKRPFNLSYSVASMLAHLCCHNGVLAQGSPTSPILSNLVCRKLDNDLSALARKYRAVYTRYCDDITMSFVAKMADNLPANICSFNGEAVNIGDELKAVIAANGFALNDEKSRLSSSSHRQEITGLTVNDFPNVRRQYIDSIRGALHSWEVHGYKLAEARWQETPYKRIRVSNTVPKLCFNLKGRLLYLKMVRGGDDEIYGRLASKFNKLVAIGAVGEVPPCKPLPIDYSVTTANGARHAVFVLQAQWFEKNELIFERQGTAFFVGQGYLLTCEHVVSNELSSDEKDDAMGELEQARHTVLIPGGKEYPVELVAVHEHYDVALLKFSGDGPEYIRRFKLSQASATVGQKSCLLGFPNWSNGRPVTVVNGEVTSVYSRSATQKLETSQQIRKGNSGGPLLNAELEVVGMATDGATYEKGNNECLTSGQIRQWLIDIKAEVQL